MSRVLRLRAVCLPFIVLTVRSTVWITTSNESKIMSTMYVEHDCESTRAKKTIFLHQDCLVETSTMGKPSKTFELTLQQHSRHKKHYMKHKDPALDDLEKGC